LVVPRSPEFIQRGCDRSAPGMAQYDDEWCAELLRGELDTADLRSGHDISRHADDEEIAEALIENNLGRHPRV